MTDEDYIDIEAEVVEPGDPSYEPEQTAIAGKINDTILRLCSFNMTLPVCNISGYFNMDGKPSSGVIDESMMDTDEFLLLQRVVTLVVPILFGLIVIVGLIGNTLVVIVVSCNPQMRSTTNVLIINLAVADLLFIMFCVPFTAFDYALPYWPFGDVWCRVVQYLVIVCAYASIYTLVLMSLDRFLAVVHPITSMSVRTVKNAFIAIGFMWTVILVSCIPALMSHGVSPYLETEPEYWICTFLTDEYSIDVFQIIFFLSSYIIPLSLIFCLYMQMLKRLWFGVAPGGHVSAESLRSKRRVTRMVVIVVVIFAVCWCPIQVVLLLKSIKMYSIATPSRLIGQVSSQVLAYMNSCVNPILYAFLSENFRKAFFKVMACHQRQTQIPRKDNERETTINNGTSRFHNTTASTANDIL